jgi:hypothetical protein
MFDGDNGSSCLLWLSHLPACFLFFIASRT